MSGCQLVKAIILSLAVLTLASCGGEDDPTVASPTGAVAEEGPLVIFLGDSIANGLHLAKDDAFPSVLHRRLTEDGVPFRLVIAGGSGLTTAGGASRMKWLLKQEPDLLVVELGANDGMRGVAVSSVQENLEAIVEAASAAEVPVLLLGVRLPPNYGDAYVRDFEAVYRDLAERSGVELLPFFMEGVGGVPELNLPDGIHPTVEGHEKLADNVEPTLRRLLQR